VARAILNRIGARAQRKTAGRQRSDRLSAVNTGKPIEEILKMLRGVLPADIPKSVEQNLRAALSGMFERMDLVSREEFDIQREVLARTRAKLEALEARLAELETSRKH
jgi:BMFP domain-containing protein YqiC